MPYHTEYRKGSSRPHKIVRSDTGRVVGSSRTEEDALASIHARLAAEHGWKPDRRRMMAR